jgi:hypothetical protein
VPSHALSPKTGKIILGSNRVAPMVVFGQQRPLNLNIESAGEPATLGWIGLYQT